MSPPPRSVRAVAWRLPRPLFVRTAFCRHLHFLWQLLTLLTVLCVALQLFGVVRQFRSTNIIGPTDEDLIVSLPVENQERGIAHSVSPSSVPDWTASRVYSWKDRKGHWLTTHEGRGHISKTESKHLDTMLARRLASTANKILAPNGYRLPTDANPSSYPQDTASVEAEVTNQLPAQNPKSVGISRMSPKVPPTEFQEPQPTNPESTQRQADQQAVLSHDEGGLCKPKNHVVFLKTHKTASSTILNILYRYGDSRNLTFALPSYMSSQLFYPFPFMSHFVEGQKTGRIKEFHIMCNHMRFQGVEVRKVMPVSTFYFSILRNPVSMMESLFAYYKSIPAFNNFKTLNDFLQDNGRSFNASLPNNHYARNVLTFDFGFNSSDPENEMELEKRSAALIAAVERDFDLIIISEYFDESMVLLKHALCWELEDVVSFRLNSRNDKSRRELSRETAEKVKRWSALDWRLYLHFNATFWQRIDTLLGREKLQEEVELLRVKRAELEKTCLLEGGAVDPGKVQDSSLKPFQYGLAVIQGYNIRPGLDNETNLLCQRLITPELQYTRALYTKQFPDLVMKIQAAAKIANVKRLITKQNAIATRNSINTNSALQNNIQTKTATVKNTQSNANVPDLNKFQAHTLSKRSTDIISNDNTVSVVQHNIETESKPNKHSAKEHNISTPT